MLKHNDGNDVKPPSHGLSHENVSNTGKARWCDVADSVQASSCRSRFPAPEDTFGDVLFSAHGVPQRSSSVTIDESSFVTNVYAPGDVDFRERLPVLVSSAL